MTTYFSVDVETGNTTATPGALLSVGIAVVKDLQVVDKIYLNLAYDEKSFDEDTIKWWQEQTEEVREYAFSWERDRLHPVSAAAMIHKFVTHHEPEKKSAIFAANPVSFDFAWVNLLFSFYGMENPFSHRTLCMRSMRYGVTGGDFGLSRGSDEGYPTLDPAPNELPHHALSDALAQAEDLINLLKYVNR